jgi:hypothetical protein
MLFSIYFYTSKLIGTGGGNGFAVGFEIALQCSKSFEKLGVITNNY